MRSCEEFEYLINLYLDDMLPSEDRQILMEHLENCPACRACFEELSALKSALGQIEEPVPAELHSRILEYVEQNSNARHLTARAIPFRARRWVRALTGVAACAVLAVVAARFVPQLDFAVGSDSAESLVLDNVMAPSVGMQESTTDAAMDQVIPDNTVVIPPSSPDNKEYQQVGNRAPDLTAAPVPEEQETGQMAEDLPPLRAENVDASNEYQVATVCKWLKVSGKREALPGWGDRHFVYEAELDGTSREYVEIAAWAEEYWTDQLTACGFAVEELTDQDVVEDGEHILLIFFWE